MKLDKLFQSLLLLGVVAFASTPAKSEEVRESVQNNSSTETQRKSTLDSTGIVTGKFLSISESISRKPRFFVSQVPSSQQTAKLSEVNQKILHLDEIEHFAKSASVLVQAPNPPSQGGGVVPITSVKANPTDKGVEIILQTTLGDQLQVTNRSTGNNFIADVLGAQLRLPSGDAFTFRSSKPLAGVTEITVTNIDANTVRVTVAGEASKPLVELFDDDTGLVFGVSKNATATQPSQQPEAQQKPEAEKPATEAPQNKPSAQQDEPIELVVTGEQDGYRAPETSSATRTDTPLRDIPQSIQVVPQQVIEDQKITRISDAVRNVSGVNVQRGFGDYVDYYNIRGFTTYTGLRNGFSVPPGAGGVTPTNNIERLEVLKGPASVLYGQFEPGGVINYITKQPLSEPYYAGEFTVGSYDLYYPSLDISGPLTDDKRLLYRLNTAYKTSGSFVDFVEQKTFSNSLALSYKISDATTLGLSYEYINSNGIFYDGFPPDQIVFKAPIERFLGEPTNNFEVKSNLINLTFVHRFNNNLEFRSTSFAQIDRTKNSIFRPSSLEADGRTVSRSYSRDISNDSDIYSVQNNLIAKFNTGSIGHQLLLGFDWQRTNRYNPYLSASGETVPSIDLFNPIYGASIPTQFDGGSAIYDDKYDTYAIYLQDQVTLLPNLKLLLGGRYDFVNQRSITQPFDSTGNLTSETTRTEFYNEAFSPRVGIVYQPIEPISLYASYSRSFVPNNARTRDGSIIEPSRGSQFEVGIKADLTKNLSATLAAYEITKTNVLTYFPDPNFPIPAGEVKSRGLEFDIGGQILPGWNIIASAYLNDTFVSEDSDPSLKGETLVNAPKQGASLWTTYEIQTGGLKGLGFGVGAFYVGEREAQLPNTFEIPSYVRADAALFYRRDNWRLGLNFKNISGTRYYETQGYYLLPGAPFTVQGTVSFQF